VLTAIVYSPKLASFQPAALITRVKARSEITDPSAAIPVWSNTTHSRIKRSTEPIDVMISKVGLFIAVASTVEVKKIRFGVAVRRYHKNLWQPDLCYLHHLQVLWLPAMSGSEESREGIFPLVGCSEGLIGTIYGSPSPFISEDLTTV
jgi:hypothetical protein